MAEEQTLTVNPSGVDTSNYNFSTASNTTNGYTDTSSTTYTRMNCKTGSKVESYRFFKFDLSSIPENAIITSVTGKVKARVDNTTRIVTATAQLYVGTTTAKGSATSTRTTTATVYNLTPGNWTRDELLNARLRISATRGTSNTSTTTYYEFYGADLTVNYAINDTEYSVLYVKESNSWKEYSKVYKKIDGEWILQENLSKLFDENVNYVKGKKE